MMDKYGTIKTVADMIECLKKCPPKAKIRTRRGVTVNVVEEPGNDEVYIEVND